MNIIPSRIAMAVPIINPVELFLTILNLLFTSFHMFEVVNLLFPSNSLNSAGKFAKPPMSASAV